MCGLLTLPRASPCHLDTLCTFLCATEITAVAGFTSIPDQKFKDQIEKIRAYKYSTVVYVVEGIALSDRLQVRFVCTSSPPPPPHIQEGPGSPRPGFEGGLVPPPPLLGLCLLKGHRGPHDWVGVCKRL